MKTPRPLPRATPARTQAPPALPRASRRAILLGAALVLCALVYAGAFGVLYENEPHAEQVFTEAGAAAVNVYVDMLEMDPVREELQVRLDFATAFGKHGALYAGVPDRDLTLQAGDGASAREIALSAGRGAAPVTLTVALRGSIGDYPLDAYTGRLAISATDRNGRAQPVRVTVWAVMSGWTLALGRAEIPPGEPLPAPAAGPRQERPAGITLDVRVTRPPASVVIATAVYIAMALVGLSGLAIGGLVFIGLRKIEATLVSALGAMVFAVPALRNAMPGAPPLGGHADILAFVWVELAVILGLTLFVIAWATRGPAD